MRRQVVIGGIVVALAMGGCGGGSKNDHAGAASNTTGSGGSAGGTASGALPAGAWEAVKAWLSSKGVPAGGTTVHAKKTSAIDLGDASDGYDLCFEDSSGTFGGQDVRTAVLLTNGTWTMLPRFNSVSNCADSSYYGPVVGKAP